MKRFLKILGIVAGVLAALVIVLIVLAQVLVTPERIKAVVLPRAEKVLHRPVSLGKVSVSLFSGVTLDQLVVGAKEGEEPFIAADSVVLRYKIWPLFFKRVVIDEVRLSAPHIRVERLADGTYNFSDLLQREEKAAAAPSEQKTTGAAIDLLVSQVAITGGEVLFLDYRMGEQAPYRYQVSELNLNARSISLEHSFPFQFGARMKEGTLSAEGEVNPQTRQGKISLAVTRLDLAAFTPYFKDKFPGQVNALGLSLKLSAEGGSEALQSKGEITLDPVDLDLPRKGRPPLAIRAAAISLNYAVAVNQAAGTLDLQKSTLAFNGIPLQVAGQVEHYAQSPEVNLLLTLPELDLERAIDQLPPALTESLVKMRPAGKVSGEFQLAGAVAEPAKLVQQGEIKFSPLQVLVGATPLNLTGSLQVAGDSVKSKGMQLQAGENRADIDLNADHLLGKVIVLHTAVKADRFLLDPLLQGAAAPAASGSAPPGQGGPAAGGPLDLPVKADGSVVVGQAVYKGLTINDFDLRYRLENNILTVQQVTGKVAQGTFAADGTVDLGRKSPTYASQLNLKGVQADPVVSAFFPQAAGTISGTMNLQTALKGEGTEKEMVKKSLSGQGDVLLTNGQLTGAGLVKGLADFLNLEELRVLRFSKAEGNFTVRQGKVMVNSNVDGQDLRLRPQGTVGLDGDLDLALNLQVAPNLAGRIGSGQVTRLLSNQQGWAQVPVKLGGTVKSPRFYLDTAALQEKVKEKAGEEIQQKLQKELQKHLPSGNGGTGNQAPGPGLEDTLKGLFRR